MKKTIIIIIALLSFNLLNAQNLIGLTKAEVQKTIKEKMNNFSLSNTTNNTYKYLKYVDGIGDETMLVFLSSEDICTSTRLISDYANLKYRMKHLNATYKKVDDTTWEFEENGSVFVIKLKKEEWFFVITTKRKKE